VLTSAIEPFSLRPPLDWRIFIGKMEDFISYRIEDCSCLWTKDWTIGKLKENFLSYSFQRKIVGKEAFT
jgi:hypothetical protein